MKMVSSVMRGLAGTGLLLTLSALGLAAQVMPPSMVAGLRWRLIGPFRGGRVLAVSGAVGHPNLFYFGSVDGGVWKTTDAGRTWRPIFNHQPVASIGAIAVAPSDPNVIYAGTGEADMRSDISYGDGIYKSTDGGRHWQYMGLTGSRAIGRIVVDPHNPDVVLVAALGDPYGPNPERGVFRSTDGGRTWKKVLYKNPDTGAIDLSADPANPRIVYAALWQVRRPFWSTYAPLSGTGGGIYKSTNEGRTWRALTGHGLPRPDGRIGVAAARGNRVYAIIRAHQQGGLYRSDNGGKSWRRVSKDMRIRGRSWYFSGIFADPRNPNIIYAVNTSLYRSIDGGRTFHALDGAPGGNDYHALWIAPHHPGRLILGSDQGTKISLNDGRTWSSWYNQPTGQMYHVALDHQFPFNVYGAQQDSGTMMIASRDNFGSITRADWHQVGAGESGYIAPDPLHPDIVYSGNYGGGVSRCDRITGQCQDVSPQPVMTPGDKLRFTWTSPLVFSKLNPHRLYFGAQYIFTTVNGGQSWQRISPDLTRGAMARPWGAHPDGLLKNPRARHAGVVYTIAPSPVAHGEIWAGTDNGLIQLTRDGGRNWRNVTPAGLPAWSKISLIAASPFAAGTAYAAVNRHRVNDLHPYIYRTRDFGRSWTRINAGIPSTAYVHAVRCDPKKRGLLFAGTETGVYVSFNGGGDWEPLQLNLPTAAIRDLAIRDNDLVAATHGRAFWILDDIASLRQMTPAMAQKTAVFYQPETAIRIRRDENQETPWPPETPAGQNPPDGAILDYYLRAPAPSLRLSIYNAAGQLIRSYTQKAKPPVAGPRNVPAYWLRPPVHLPDHAGLNRFAWSLRYPHPKIFSADYTIAAIPHQTPRRLRGPLVTPGIYTLKLSVNGRAYTQKLTVKNDPRVQVSAAALTRQLALELRITRELAADARADQAVKSLHRQVVAWMRRWHGQPRARDAYALARPLRQQLRGLMGAPHGRGFHFHVRQKAPDLARVNGLLTTLYSSVAGFNSVSGADAAPTVAQRQASRQLQGLLHSVLARWRRVLTQTLPRVNAAIQRAKLPALQ